MRGSLRLADEEADPRRQRRLGSQTPGLAARRLGLPVQQRALSRRGRHRRRRHGPASRRSAEKYAEGDFARRRMDRRHAEHQRRMGRLRRRQQRLLPQSHSICRSRRAAGPADGRRLGAVYQLPRADRLRAYSPGDGARPRLSEARAGRTAAGSAAGARITSTAPGRC